MYCGCGRSCGQCSVAMLAILSCAAVIVAAALQVQGGWLCSPGALLTYLWKNCGGNNRGVNMGGGADRGNGISVGSPCPSVFQYEWDGVEWYGVINAPSVPHGTPARLVARLSIGRALPTKYAGTLELLGARAEVLQAMLNEQPIRYRVNFPLPYPIPVVTSITLNERLICSGPAVVAPIVTSIVLEHSLYPHGQPLNSGIPQQNPRFNSNNFNNNNKNGNGAGGDDFSRQTPPIIAIPVPVPSDSSNTFNNEEANSRTDNPRPSRTTTSTINIIEQGVYNDVCGNPVSVRALVANGEVTKRGSYPWLAALFAQKALGLEFICGGTLVSSRYVVTAAHCIRYGENRALNPDELLVVLGKYRIRRWTERGSVVRDVERIVLHNDYGALSGDADLAAIELAEPVTFTDTIRPVCAWSSSSKIPNEEIAGREAIIVGWGRDEGGQKVTPEPRQTKVRIVSQEECLRSRLEFRYITSNRTLCAGGVTPESGPCSGDSGGGLYLQNQGRWYLRGVISMSLVDPDTKSCDLNSYSVFVDMSKFDKWLAQFLH